MNADRLAIFLACLVAVVAAPAGAQSPATEGQADWRLASPLAASRGLALWLNDGAGSWRLELGVLDEASVGADDLFARRGEGWTLACAGDAAVLLQPWGKPWRETDPGFAAAVAAMLARWEGAAALSPAPAGPWRAGPARSLGVGEAITVRELPADWNPAGASAGEGGSLRRELAARGRGRGGQGVRLRLDRTPAGGLVLTSARWPGRLDLSPPVLARRPEVPAEAYLPVWSLEEIGVLPRDR